MLSAKNLEMYCSLWLVTPWD